MTSHSQDRTVDCRSDEGVTMGLIDGAIAIFRVLRLRDLTHPVVVEALRDIRADEDVRSVLLDPLTLDDDVVQAFIAPVPLNGEAEAAYNARLAHALREHLRSVRQAVTS